MPTKPNWQALQPKQDSKTRPRQRLTTAVAKPGKTNNSRVFKAI